MARNQRLNATITIGAALQNSVRRNLDVVGRGLKNVGDEIRTVTTRQKELDRERRVLERQGQSVEALDREYQDLTRTLDRLADRQRRLRNVQGAMGDVGGAFSNMATTIGRTARTAGIAIGGLGAAVFGVANTTANAAREIGLFANISNAGTTEFQRMAAAARTVGIEQDKMADILKDVNDRVGDFLTTGGGPMADFFEEIGPKIGITADHFRDLSGPEALQLFVTSLEKAGLSQQEMTFYMEAMASDATALIPLLQNNGSEMFRLARAADEVGAILDEETIEAARRFTEQMGMTQMALTGVRNIIGAELMPVVGQLAAEFTAFVAENRPQVEAFANTLADGVRRAVPVIGQVASGLLEVSIQIGTVVGRVAEMVGGWENFGIILGGIFASKAIASVGMFVFTVGRLGVAVLALVAPGALPAVAVAIKAIGAALIANPIGAAVTAIALAATLVITNWDKIRPALQPIIDWLGGAFTTVWEGAIEPVIDGLVGAGDAIVAAWDGVKAGLGAVLDWMGEKFDAVLRKIQPVIDALTWIRDKGAAGIGAVGDLFGANDGPSGGSSDRLQARAVGGSFAPGAVLVGERGPELRFENRAGFIATNRQLGGMADMAERIQGAAVRGAAGAVQQVQQVLEIAAGAITINAAPGMDPRAIADAVLVELQRRQRGALFDAGAM